MAEPVAAVQPMRGPCLSDLPEEVLLKVMKQLDARELAALLVQDRRLRALAGDAALWHAHAQVRWPGCTAAHYGGDWPRLYRCRAALPRELVRAADRCHALTVRASNGNVRLNSASLRFPAGQSPPGPSSQASGSSSGGASSSSNSSSSGGGACGGSSGSVGVGAIAAVAAAARPGGGNGSPQKANVYGFSSVPYCNVTGMLLEEAMQAVFTVGLALAAARAQGGASPSEAAKEEVARFRADAAWWLSHRPEVVVRFAKRTGDALREFDLWGGGGFSAWPEVPWRRSALEFLLDVALGPAHGSVCASVVARLQREASVLDDAIRALRGDVAGHLDVRRPSGVPRSHWWFFLGGGGGGASASVAAAHLHQQPQLQRGLAM